MGTTALPWNLSPEDGQTLLRLARQAIGWMVSAGDPAPLRLDVLAVCLWEPGASFVTLHVGDVLRGCIGSGEAYRPLVIDVVDNAIKVTYRDPRFPPVTPEELPRLHIEVSVLSPLRRLFYDDPQELLARLRPGVDGVVIQYGSYRALFLPQVWKMLPDPAAFMSHLCQKAGLSPQAYRRDPLTVYTFETRSFQDPPPDEF